MPQIKERFHRRINNVWIGSYYRLYELESPDTKEVKVDPKLIACLDKLQRESESRVVITSGYRTPAHNEKVGGAARSFHMKGMAVDCYQVGCKNKKGLLALAKRGLKCGFTTAIIYKGHVHFDVRYDGLGLRYAK